MHRMAVFPRVGEGVLDPLQRRVPLSGRLKRDASLIDHYCLDDGKTRSGIVFRTGGDEDLNGLILTLKTNRKSEDAEIDRHRMLSLSASFAARNLLASGIMTITSYQPCAGVDNTGRTACKLQQCASV